MKLSIWKRACLGALMPLICLLSVVLSVNPVQAKEWSAPVWSPNLIQGTLANGLRYVVYNSGKADQPFNLRLIVNAGSVDETRLTGIAHGVEHMVFQQTTGHPETIQHYVGKLGWKTGLQVNAVTRQTETQYMVRTRPHDALDLQGSMALLAELAFHARFEQSSWLTERKVIREEMRQDDGVAERLNQQKKAITRNGSRYANNTTIGTTADLARATATDLQAFYRRFYVPANMTLVAAGNVDPTEFKLALTRYFGSVPASAAPARPYVQLPLQPGLVVRKIQDSNGSSSRVTMGLRITQQPRHTLAGKREQLENYLIRKLLREIGQSQSRQLPAKVKGLVLTIDNPTNERLTLAIGANTREHATGLTLILTELERLRQHGFDKNALARVIKQAKATLENNEIAVRQRDFANWEDKITEAILQASQLEDSALYTARTRAWLDQITLAQLNARLRQMLAAQDRFIYFQLPAKVDYQLPTATAIEQQMQQLASTRLAPITLHPTVTPPQKKAIPAPSLPEPVITTEGQIRTSQADPSLPVQEWTLGNGDRVIWLDKATPDGKIYIEARSHAGFARRTLPAEYQQTAVQLWQQRGFRFWNADQNSRWQQTEPRWQWQQTASTLQLGAVIHPDQLTTLLKAYWHSQRSGEISASALQAVQHDLAAQLDQPATPLDRAWTRLRQQQASKPLPLPERSQLVTAIDETLAAPVSFYLVGKLDKQILQQGALRYLATIPRRQPVLRPRDQGYTGHQTARVAAYDDDKATVHIEGNTPLRWSPEQAFVVSTLTPIAQRALRDELRLKLGGVYRLAFEMRLDPDSNSVTTTLNFVCDPARADELSDAARKVLAGLATPVGNTPIQRLHADIDFAEGMRQQSANTWLHRLVLSDQAYGDNRYFRHSHQLRDLISSASLTAAAKTIFPQPNMITLIGLPKHNHH